MSAATLNAAALGKAIRLHPADNVMVARLPIAIGDRVADGVVSRSQVSPGHKIAARDIRSGDPVLKYNVVIGFAAQDISAGSLVFSHNIALHDYDRDYAFGADYRPVEVLPEARQARFDGYVRADGRVGTRNFIGIVSTVNCSATAVHRVAEWFTPERLRDFPNVDGVAAFAHATGCGMEMGEPMHLLRRTLAGYARHPNFAGVLVVGLGCERNQLAAMLEEQGLAAGSQLKTFVMQEEGGTRRTIEAGIEAVQSMLPAANRAQRSSVSASHLSVGLQCGGSDSFSAITANPAVGAAMDILVRHGGTAILSETPEINGVEHMLTRRACTEEVGRKLLERLRWWKEEYALGRDVQLNGKVAPGNSAGGLANIFEKSLGSAMKGGTTGLMEVYRYAEPVDRKGMVFMDTPGFDPCSATGQIAGGANLILFTTGRGSMFGAKPVPSIKLATNTPMFERLTEDMDINCGEILDGTASMDQMAQRIFADMLEVASGRRTKSELLGLGDHEFVPWNIGIVG
ncbi:MAG TPA: altronate dehydratase family protein [Ramlibacter sp.]|nr:altronate dehydratase family protein [Ramlibacter sp.]